MRLDQNRRGLNGRLKRCSAWQLRHASVTEAIVAEGAKAPTPTWTFHDLIQHLHRGQYETIDDLTLPEDVGPVPARLATPGTIPLAGDPSVPTRRTRSSDARDRDDSHGFRGRSRSRARSVPGRGRSREPVRRDAGVSEGHSPGDEDRTMKRKEPPLPTEGEEATSSSSRPTWLEPDPDMSLEQLLRDPQYQIPRRYRAAPARIAPTGKSELEKNEQFKRQRQKREEEEAVFLANTVDSEEALFTMPQEALAVCQVELAMPESKSQWRAFRRDEQAWAAQMLRKTEVRWSALDNEQKKAFEQAKELEVQQWLQAEATRAVEGHIDPQRAVRMRWVLTFKESGQAKARIVLIGYEDPDLHELVSSSPTMCRRTRQLVLQFAAQKGWKCLKGDIKSAFLQGPASQEARNLYAVPVKELAAAMKIPAGNLVQVRKAAYGLVNAPAEFFRAINGALKELGFQQMRTEPCGWVFKVQDPQTKEFKTAGVICSHVDDFIIAGNEQCPEWHRALEGFFEKFRWSPWEFGAFSHCGIQIRESSDGSKILDHSKYCETLDQIPVESQRGDSDPATPREIGQLRALLGAAQWRAYNTAPMHAAKVGILLSQVSSATARTLREANKLAREIHGQRILSVRINYLPDTPVEEVTFVCWTDAAVANRKDLSSTGGHRLSRPRRPSWMERSLLYPLCHGNPTSCSV